jgi:hypothetical protein
MGTCRKLLLVTSSRGFRCRVSKTIDLDACFKEDETGGRPQRKIISPLEALHCHFLKTPPSHFRLRKVKG